MASPQEMPPAGVGNTGSSGASFWFGDVDAFTAQGGQYRLCWCAGLFPCSAPEAFVVDMGELRVIGPSPLDQDRTCVAGQTCMLDGLLGMHPHEGDQILVLDTCAPYQEPRALRERFVASGDFECQCRAR